MKNNGMSELRTAAFLGLACMAASPVFAANKKKVEHPNVMLIMCDQMQWSAIASSGNDFIQTPNLNRLASAGMAFNRMYCAAYPSTPSRGVLLTSLYPGASGVTNNNQIMPDFVPTMGTIFKANGYDTAWIGKMHLGGQPEGHKALKVTFEDGVRKAEEIENWDGYPADDYPQLGFDHWVGTVKPYLQYLKDEGIWDQIPNQAQLKGAHVIAPKADRSKPLCAAGYSTVPEKYFIESYLADHAIEYLQARKGDKPFFMGVSFEGPHPPYNPPVPWHEMYDPDETPLPASLNDDLADRPYLKKDKKWMRERWTDEQFRANKAIYYGFVSYIDKQVGRLLDALEAQGLADNTIVLFMSDHGDLHGEHGFMNKIFGPFEELIRVPFLIAGPGVSEGKTYESVASLVDVLPTLLDLCDLPEQELTHGQSFRKSLQKPSKTYREDVFLYMGGQNIIRVTDDNKYVKWNGRPHEIYDYQLDPDEMKSLLKDPAYKAFAEESKQAIQEFVENQQKPAWVK